MISESLAFKEKKELAANLPACLKESVTIDSNFVSVILFREISTLM
jgi:hypothetical protein